MNTMRILDNWDNHGQKIHKNLPSRISFDKLNEDWAYHIHRQTLSQLESRGGMGIIELIMNIKKIQYSDRDTIDKQNAHIILESLLNNNTNTTP